jgi:hypothetical protein
MRIEPMGMGWEIGLISKCKWMWSVATIERVRQQFVEQGLWMNHQGYKSSLVSIKDVELLQMVLVWYTTV